MGIVRGAIARRGNCPGGSCPGGSCPGGSCPGRNCTGAIVQGVNCPRNFIFIILPDHTNSKFCLHFSFVCSHVFKSSRSYMFFKNVILKNFTKFIGKHLCWSQLYSKETYTQVYLANFPRTLFLQKTSGWLFCIDALNGSMTRPVTLLNDTPTQVFSFEFGEIFKNIFLTEHLWMIASLFCIAG